MSAAMCSATNYPAPRKFGGGGAGTTVLVGSKRSASLIDRGNTRQYLAMQFVEGSASALAH